MTHYTVSQITPSHLRLRLLFQNLNNVGVASVCVTEQRLYSKVKTGPVHFLRKQTLLGKKVDQFLLLVES